MSAAQNVAPRSVLDGKYALLREIGSGASGTVYEAEHVVVGKYVAIKVMNPGAFADPAYRDHFVTEARAAARIAHANVVDIHDLGLTPEGVPYLVMELLRGETLEDIIETRGALPPSYACELMLQVLAGLSAAHVQGFLHCDLKPANVMVTHPRPDRPHVKVLDFGIARRMLEADGSTAKGSGGTPMFMAPEQARGESVDARSDIYSACAMLYAMLAGGDPFAGNAAGAVRRVAATRVSMRNFRYLSGLQRLQEGAGWDVVEKRIGGFDQQEKPVARCQRETRHVKRRMVRHRQST